MRSEVKKAFIGAFVLGAAVLGAAVVVIWGSGRFLSEKEVFVLFFESSIKGLDVGAPVMFKGVKIGNVKAIDIEAAEEDGGISFWIPVLIEIDHDKISKLRESTPRFGTDEKGVTARLRMLIDQGLRGQLRLQSIVTGKLYIALDFFHGKPAKFVAREKDYLEIPTIPTPFEEISDTALKIFDEIRSLPIKELLSQLTNMITSMNTLLARPDTEKALVNVSSLMQDISTLVKNIDNHIRPLEGTLTRSIKNAEREFVSTLREMRNTLNGAEKAMGKLQEGFGEGSLLHSQLIKTLDEISKAARNLRLLADYLERHPEALLKGKGRAKELPQ